MPRFKYVGPHDAVDLDGVGAVVRGVPFEGPLGLGDHPDIEPVGNVPDPDDMTLEELKQYAEKHDIDLRGATKKADVLAIVKES